MKKIGFAFAGDEKGPNFFLFSRRRGSLAVRASIRQRFAKISDVADGNFVAEIRKSTPRLSGNNAVATASAAATIAFP
jgi:hypothetical protein